MIIRGLESAAKGMISLMEQNDSTANNVANVNTIGYKKQVLTFQNIYDATVVDKDLKTEEYSPIGSLSVGSKVQKLTYDFSQGAFTQTGNTFDLAIQGDGFFKIEDYKTGEMSYTRNGAFTMNSQGFLTTKDGDYVMDERNKRIRIRTNGVVMNSMKDLIISERGQIELVNKNDRITMQRIGIFDFSNKEDLRNIGGSKFVPKTGYLNPELKASKFVIEQGALEMANTNIVNEMIKTISTTRNYESLSKVVKNSSDTLNEALKIARL